MFSSPSGVSHFLICKRYSSRCNPDEVFVPFRGISFLNEDSAVLWVCSQKQVFVPFRGISFLNNIQLHEQGRWDRVFVPFRGISFLNIIWAKEWILGLWVFVPFRGISFLNPIPHTPHSMRPHRTICVVKPTRSIFHVLDLPKIPANPVFEGTEKVWF